MQSQQVETSVNITYQLEGEDARRFLRVKDSEKIKSNAEMARALTLRQIDLELEGDQQITKAPRKRAA